MDRSVLGRSVPKFKDKYIIEAKIGEGTFGIVYKVFLLANPHILL